MPSPSPATPFQAERRAFAESEGVEGWLVALDEREKAWADPAIWIKRLSADERATYLKALKESPAAPRPLWGLPFAIKDNIDLAGVETTGACPGFAATPAAHSATVVSKLIAAGALPLGKTNLDQFATGLVGVRSPYGTPRNPHDAAYLPGGSSSGSATAVAAGLCSFSLGTDTAGSGRVPAAFNELVGLKPTRGLLSTRGVLPACRSLDCVSIFSRTVGEAAEVLAVAAGYDSEDPLSRPTPATRHRLPARPRLGVPRAAQREFFGDDEAKELFTRAIQSFAALGVEIVEIDYQPFQQTAQLLYGGPWVAERYAAVGAFIDHAKDGVHPITRQIISGGRTPTAATAFRAWEDLATLRRQADAVWAQIDVMLTPTTGTIYRCDEVAADPVRLNSNLGYYTNHFNLLDLCGLALPAGRLRGHLPWGVTLSAPAFRDDCLLELGARYLGEPLPPLALTADEPHAEIAVCGAHLSGLPLNGQLVALGARLVRTTRTAPRYRLVALPNTQPPKPGLFAVNEGGGSIEVELWRFPVAHWGTFVRSIPAPLGLGTLTLEDGTTAQGFLCEAAAAADGEDITSLGGWRTHLAQITPRV